MVEYVLPFNYPVVRISQGYNGPWTHKRIRENTDQTYSLDFALPVGTDVIAARGGEVRFYWDNSERHYSGYDFEVGSKFMANFIEIIHDDGTVACYQHFARRSVRSLGIKKGDSVKQGQMVGKTGLSGWIGAVPHLHFMVYEKKPKQYGDRIIRTMATMPVTFVNYGGPLEHKLLF